jgi:hypothetical protein
MLNSHSSLQSLNNALMSGSLLNGNVTFYSVRVVGLNITIEYLVLNGVIHGQQVHAAQTMHAHGKEGGFSPRTMAQYKRGFCSRLCSPP